MYSEALLQLEKCSKMNKCAGNEWGERETKFKFCSQITTPTSHFTLLDGLHT